MDTQTSWTLDQAQAVERGVETWKRDHVEAQSVYYLELLVLASVAIAKGVIMIQRNAWRALFDGDKDYPSQSHGRQLDRIYRAALHAFHVVEECIHEAERLGYAVDEAAAFRQLHRGVAKARLDFADRWPLFTPEEIEAGEADVAEGRRISAEEFFDGVAGGDR